MAFVLKIKMLGSEKLYQLASISGPQLMWSSSPCSYQWDFSGDLTILWASFQLPHSSLKFLWGGGYLGALLPFDNHPCLFPWALGDRRVTMRVAHSCECWRLFMGVFDRGNQENHRSLKQGFYAHIERNLRPEAAATVGYDEVGWRPWVRVVDLETGAYTQPANLNEPSTPKPCLHLQVLFSWLQPSTS